MKTLLTMTYLSLLAASACAQDVVRLTQPALIVSDDVRLRDIAVIEADAARSARLADAVISAAPLAGQRRVLTQDDVLMRLRMQDIDVSDLVVTGEEETVITRKSRLISGETLADAVRARVSASFDEGADAIVEISRRPADVIIPDAAYEMTVDFDDQVKSSGTFSVPVSFVQGGVLTARVNVACTARVFVPMAVTTRDIARGEVIGEGDFMMKKEEAVSAVKGAYVDPAQLIGKVATQQIRRSRVVTERMTEIPVAVKRGAHVTMIYEADNLRITAVVVARQDGRTGDMIAVTNPNTKKDLTARIEAPGLVRFVY
jgi:flagella basal body P-ring formation protein FlgA